MIGSGRKYVGPIASAILCVTLNVAVFATDTNAKNKQIENCMADAAKRLAFNGVVLAKLSDGTVERPFGTADAAHHVAVTDQTRFSIGSAGKMFTAVAIGKLVDENKVRFEAPIGQYLSGLKPEIAAITIEQLLNHSSGLGNYFVPQNAAAIDAAKTASDLLPLALTTPLAFAPGSQRAYSNSGYIVLGAIIERVTGKSYREYIQAAILDPLGMTRTSFDADGSAEPMTQMSPSGPLSEAVPSQFPHQHASPAGGLFSTAGDLSLFLGALTTNRIISADTERELFRARTTQKKDEPNGYALGFTVASDPVRRVGHGGGAPGVNAQVALYPESGTQLIALSNYDPPTAERMANVLERAIFSQDPTKACSIALADPAMYKPMAPPHP